MRSELTHTEIPDHNQGVRGVPTRGTSTFEAAAAAVASQLTLGIGS